MLRPAVLLYSPSREGGNSGPKWGKELWAKKRKKNEKEVTKKVKFAYVLCNVHTRVPVESGQMQSICLPPSCHALC